MSQILDNLDHRKLTLFDISVCLYLTLDMKYFAMSVGLLLCMNAAESQ